ncbi:MAG: hypothetical protein LUE93_03015 [Bacteroides sp.]|nr:hypothetical protein [Bacteroides sp.]
MDKLNESPAIEGEDKVLLELAASNTDRLNKLVTQLLDMHKNQSGSMRLSLSFRAGTYPLYNPESTSV